MGSSFFSGGIYKTGGSNASIEFQAGTFGYAQVAGTAGSLTVGVFNWNGGQLGDGGGTLTSSAATIGGSGAHDLLGPYTWTANGTSAWDGGSLNAKAPTSALNGNDFLLDNTGTFNIRTDSDFTAQPTVAGQPQMFFRNGAAATIDKTDTGTAGKTTIYVPLANYGTVSLSDSILTLAGGDGADHFGTTPEGTFTIASDATLEILAGHFAAGTLTNNGTLAISGGTLFVIGSSYTNSAKIRLAGGQLSMLSFVQSAGGELDVVVSGTIVGTGFGQIHSLGSVTLGGTLSVSNATGYVPATGSTYVIVNGTSVGGTFGTTTLGTYSLAIGTDKVTLTA